jgi:hypothetical protein
MYEGIYHKFPFVNFKVNFKNLVVSVRRSEEHAARDGRLLINALSQRPILAPPSYPPWHSSAARALLVDDIKAGVIDGMAPSAVRMTRPEYASYPEKKFRDNLYKERHLPIKRAYWEHIEQQRQNKKQQKRDRKAKQNL